MIHNRFREALETGRFVVSVEALPGRGACEASQVKMMEEACQVWDSGLADAISVTDAPSGTPALLADAFAGDLLARGAVPLVHFTCKDRNRNQIEAQLYAMQRAGIENLLCMTGDAPTNGWQGQARPVFDLDPVTMIQLVSDMNKGMTYPRGPKMVSTAPANFFPGAVVSPFKWTEGEVFTQLYKLKKKVAAGAKFIVSQVGYDTRKMQEMLMLVRDEGIDVPLIANIYVLTAGAAAFMNKGGIPGCDVTDELLATLQAEKTAEDKGVQARLDRAAKIIAAARGMGYAGVHIGGSGVTAEALRYMLDKAEEYAADWQAAARDVMFAQPGCFWAYKEDPETGLNTSERNPLGPDEFGKRAIRGNYRLSRAFHHTVFVPGKPINSIFRAVEDRREKTKGRNRHHGLEHLGKVFLYDCIDCGDCGLYACGYTCPMSQCPKSQRNGACGGSKDGWCEVFPGERYCIWYKAYQRLKHYGEQEKLASYIVPPNNWANWQKSPWGATVKGIDGYARREWMPGVEPDKEFKEGPKVPADAPKRYSE